MILVSRENLIEPGFVLIHKTISEIMETKNTDIQCSQKEIKVMKEKIDDYVMYIWMILGDTRYNRRGYRSAVDTLTNKILNRRKNASQ